MIKKRITINQWGITMASYPVALVSLGLSAPVLYRMFKTFSRVARRMGPQKRRVCLAPLSLPICPQSTIITFDIHGVLFTKDYKKIAALVWHNLWVFKILFYALNPFFIADLVKLIIKKGVTEEYIIGLGQKHRSFAQFVPLGIAIANAQKPIIKTVQLAHALKKKGYTLHILSNIGPTIYADLAQHYPTLFAPFDAVIVPLPENNYCGKPHQAFFDQYAQKYAGEKQILLIDDKPINMKKAARAGMGCICFVHPNALGHTLSRLAIL
jgi:HAD superfamily hydrolase (TIGR01509 family)